MLGQGWERSALGIAGSYDLVDAIKANPQLQAAIRSCSAIPGAEERQGFALNGFFQSTALRLCRFRREMSLIIQSLMTCPPKPRAVVFIRLQW